LGRDISEERARQDSIRQSLIASIRAVHVPYARVPTQILETLRDVMASHTSVYTTNYDLLAYWALMKDKDGKDRFIDYLWGGCFDMADTARQAHAKSRLLFLHGAVHLYRSEDGRTCKDVADPTKDLLTKVAEAKVDPVFISECTSAHKQAA